MPVLEMLRSAVETSDESQGGQHQLQLLPRPDRGTHDRWIATAIEYPQEKKAKVGLMAKKKPDPELSHVAEQLRPLAVRCDSLVLDPANARKHPQKNLEAIKGSLRSFGQVKPLVVRDQGRVVCCGNGTLEAARALGWEWVAANVVPLSDSAAAALAIADNRASDLGEWDTEALDSLTKSMQVDDLQLQEMLDELRAEVIPAAAVDVVEDEAPVDQAGELQKKWGTTSGQLWVIPSKTVAGKSHRLLCGDSTKAEDVERVMGGEPVDAIVSDPPYGCKNDCDYTRFSGGKNPSRNFNGRDRRSGEYVGIVGDDKPFDPYPWTKYPRVILWGFQFFADKVPQGTVLVWNKKRDNQLGVFLSDGELAWQSGGAGVYIFAHIWHGMDRESEHGETTLHPSQKPIALMAWCIERVAETCVLDPYSGSGATIVASEQLGRLCRAIEIEPKYIAVALERLSRLGLSPELAS